MFLENNMSYHEQYYHRKKKSRHNNNKHSKKNRFHANSHANSHGHTEIAKDAIFLLENWQVFPKINTEVLFTNIPFFLSPVEHFKEVIRKIKNNKKESCSYYSEHPTNHSRFSDTSSCAETSGYSDKSDSDCSFDSSDTDDDNHSSSCHSRHSSKNSCHSRRSRHHTERKKKSPDDLLSPSTTTIEESSPPVWDSSEWQD